jgi:hypothetical protein
MGVVYYYLIEKGAKFSPLFPTFFPFSVLNMGHYPAYHNQFLLFAKGFLAVTPHLPKS